MRVSIAAKNERGAHSISERMAVLAKQIDEQSSLAHLLVAVAAKEDELGRAAG